MGSFAYVAKNRLGQQLDGAMVGEDVDEVVGHLQSQGLIVLKVVDASKAGDSRPWHARFASMQIGRTNTRALALFTRQLVTGVQAGIPLVRALRGLASDSSNKRLSATVGEVASRIERGESLAGAMAAHPDTFDTMYVNLMNAGERSGSLDRILDELAAYLEKVDMIKTKVRGALAYPGFVLGFASFACLVLLLKVIPTFEDIYKDLGQNLPKLTQIVVGLSKLVRHNLVLAILVLLAAAVAIYLATRTRQGRYAKDLFMIRVPLFGPIVNKALLSRFARTLGILLKSGLPILQALELVREAAGNTVIANGILDAERRISAGQSVTAAFRATGKFPEMVLQLMSTGEESGELDDMLLKASDFYDRQVEASVHGITTLIEPVMIVLVGGMVGIVVVSMFLPIFSMGDAVLKGGFKY